ncbi:Protein F01D5.1 [Aphelenchoides avenae]|nr:Protein F01D5.1 [Aphelenchus avenae]
MAFSACVFVALVALIRHEANAANECLNQPIVGPCLVGGTPPCPDPTNLCDSGHAQGPSCCKKPPPPPTNPTNPTNPNPPTTPCVDKAANCAANKGLCTNPLYQPIMRDNCQSSCGLCSGGNNGGTPAKPPCQDANASCVSWNVRQFCASSYYSAEQKRQYCEKTCGFCTP